MVKKLQKINAKKMGNVPLSGSVKDSAQLIWQAGLGAFSRAQAEGTKAFEALVKEGMNLQRKTQSVAEEKISEATHKMSDMATGISSKASGQWDKLESIFEERVAKALNKLGVPSSKDVSALIERIEELNKSVQKLSAKSATTRAGAKPAARAAAKPAAKPEADTAVNTVAKAPAKRAVKVAVQAVRKSVTPAKQAVAEVAAAKPAVKRVRTRKAAPVVVAAEATPAA
jgi:poly(hydroxyalkanoate) granule-associated protein